MTRSHRLRALVAAAACAAAVGGLGAAAGPAAAAPFGIDQFSATLSTDQAGGHPDFTVSFELANSLQEVPGLPDPVPTPEGLLKDLDVELPPGLVGDPTAMPRCTDEQISSVNPVTGGIGDCPAATQVGTIQLVSSGFDGVTGQPTVIRSLVPVYNMVPSPGRPARFEFSFGGAVFVPIDIAVRTGRDYGITAQLRNVTSQLPLIGATMTLWGDPASAVHDPERFPCVTAFTPEAIPNCSGPSGAPPAAFMTNPGQCETPVGATLRATSWGEPARWVRAEAPPVALRGCDKLQFEPTIEVAPETTLADAPTGLEIGIHVPRDVQPTKLAVPDLRDAVVRLPAGVAINPAAADGLQGCTDEQAGIASDAPVACPDASAIGSVEIATPLLAEPLAGKAYLGTPKSGDPASGQMFRMFLVAEGSGVSIRLLGSIVPDPVTGQLTATFAGNPQLPFTDLTVRLDGGPRAVLATPATCGTATTTSALAPWSGGAAAQPSSAFAVSWDGAGGACPAALPFEPSFEAGTTSPLAGAFSPLTMTVARADRHDTLGSIALETPPGLLGMISSVDLCGEADAAAGTCDEGSRIGSATVAAGAGSQPFSLGGRVYLTGPYRGAPFGLSIVVPAEAGPYRGAYSLGTVVVRASIAVDRRDAHLTIASDPLPQILKGVPLRLRSVNVHADRRGFTFNPTRCRVAGVIGRIASAAGASRELRSRFEVGGCAALPFAPRMSLRVGARGRTRRGVTTPLQVTLAMGRGQANNRVVDVTLPRTLNSRLAVVNNRNACQPAQFAADRCPQAIGTAVAATPLLREPLRGSVYLVTNPARKLPDMVVALRGQVDVDLVGRISITRALTLRTTFDTVPDVPISRFALSLVAGRRGAVGTVGNLCAAATRAVPARLAFTSQSGRRVAREQRMRVAGCGPARGARRRNRGQARGRGGGRAEGRARARRRR